MRAIHTGLLVLVSVWSCPTLSWSREPAEARPAPAKTVWLDDLLIFALLK